MEAEIALCICNKWTVFDIPCPSTCTQEDLLCNECRGRMCTLVRYGNMTGLWYHEHADREPEDEQLERSVLD
jgi:hypothetical protein